MSFTYTHPQAPTTWQEAAKLAAFDVHTEYVSFMDFDNAEMLSSIVALLDPLVWHVSLDHRESLDESAAFAVIGARALRGYMRLIATEDPKHVSTLSEWRAKHQLDTICDVIARKQHDYGHGNILKFGLTGIVVRISDKVERIKNLQAKGVEGHEPEVDAWLDIVGYSLIAIMLQEGTFGLALAEDAA